MLGATRFTGETVSCGVGLLKEAREAGRTHPEDIAIYGTSCVSRIGVGGKTMADKVEERECVGFKVAYL